MALLNLFKLEKLKILVYGNARRIGLPKSTFEVMFNPESYSLSYENKFSEKQAINSTGKKGTYSLSKPASLELKIILDGTGVSFMGASDLLQIARGKNDVYKRVQEFLNLTTMMDGKLHQPNFLVISWGEMNFKCRLETVEITYTLFDKSGKPLRAELDTKFVNELEDKERLKKENKSSPDLTHSRIVKAHDTLPLLCEEIYGSPDYYIKIAMANKLNDFRNLVPGQELFFPPVKK